MIRRADMTHAAQKIEQHDQKRFVIVFRPFTGGNVHAAVIER